MKPHKILIASVLKPVDDVRTTRKIGKSLAKISGVDVHVAGFQSKVAAIEGIYVHPLFYFNRLSLQRAAAGCKLLRLVARLKPSILLVTTHELLPAALLAKLLWRTKIVYDVQENYYRNILYSDAFPEIIRRPLAKLVRGFETAAARLIDYFLLAEQTYQTELPFLSDKAATIENKFHSDQPTGTLPASPKNLSAKGQIRLLYSGTIAFTYGILEAIYLAVKLHQTDNRYHLTIIGFAAQAEVLQQVKSAIYQKPYITLIGGDELVPHSEIVKQIQQADIGLLPYQPNPSTAHCIPTKLYEYLANQLPMLVQQNPIWQLRIDQWQAGLMIDFKTVDPADLHHKLMIELFYTKGQPTDVFWHDEETRLIEIFENELLT